MSRIATNIMSIGTHAGNVTKLAGGIIRDRYKLGRFGRYHTQVKECGASECPIGVIMQVAEKDEPVNVALLGVVGSTLKMLTATAVNAGEKLYTAEKGCVQVKPESAGKYYEVGIALHDAHKDDIVEVASCVAREVNIEGELEIIEED